MVRKNGTDSNINEKLWYNKIKRKTLARTSVLARVCTDSGKLIEHIYGFLMIVGRILAKYDEKKSDNQSE
jgi:hypothetical protein